MTKPYVTMPLHVRLKGLNNDITEKDSQPFLGFVTYVLGPHQVNAIVFDSVGRCIVCHELELVRVGETPGSGSWACAVTTEDSPRIQLLN